MPNFSVILHKRTTESGKVPTSAELSAGELAINTADGKIFVKTISEIVESFSNDKYNSFVLNVDLSGSIPQYGGNTVTGEFSNVLGGYNNDVSGVASTTTNGENNDIAGDLSFIGSGYNNTINISGDFGAILGGQNNVLNHPESFIIGSNITSHASNFTYVNNISATNTLTAPILSATVLYGNGSNINEINASSITSGTLIAARLPVFNGDVIADTTNGSVSSTVVAIQGEPISTQTPNPGQVLQWTGTAWTPGAITTGGSGGGGLVYYLNFANQAQAPTTNLPTTPNTPRELGSEGTFGSSSVTLNNVSTTHYDLICGFVSLTGSPGTVTIPAGLWDFNIWASATSTRTNQTSLLLNVYKYDGSNIPTLLTSSSDIFIYDPNTTAQYIASVVFPQTTLLETDRIYIELTAKATQHNKNLTIYFGGTTPTHVHTTFPSVRGSGLVKVINGIYQSPASLLVNTDVAANAAIDQSKINGLTDVANKADSTYTTVQAKSATEWDNALANNYTQTNFFPLSGGVVSGSISATGIISASASDIRINVINSSTNRTFTDADNNRVVHIDTTTASLCAIFPSSLSNGFNVAIMNTGTNNLVLSSAQLNSAGTIIATRYGGAFVYKDSDNLFAVGRLV